MHRRRGPAVPVVCGERAGAAGLGSLRGENTPVARWERRIKGDSAHPASAAPPTPDGVVYGSYSERQAKFWGQALRFTFLKTDKRGQTLIALG